VAVILVRDSKISANQAGKAISLQIWVLVDGHQHLDAGKDQERSEQVDNQWKDWITAAPTKIKAARMTRAPRIPRRAPGAGTGPERRSG